MKATSKTFNKRALKEYMDHWCNSFKLKKQKKNIISAIDIVGKYKMQFTNDLMF